MGSNKGHLLRDSQQPTNGGTGVPSVPKMARSFSQNLFHHVFRTHGQNEKGLKDFEHCFNLISWMSYHSLDCHSE